MAAILIGVSQLSPAQTDYSMASYQSNQHSNRSLGVLHRSRCSRIMVRTTSRSELGLSLLTVGATHRIPEKPFLAHVDHNDVNVLCRVVRS